MMLFVGNIEVLTAFVCWVVTDVDNAACVSSRKRLLLRYL